VGSCMLDAGQSAQHTSDSRVGREPGSGACPRPLATRSLVAGRTTRTRRRWPRITRRAGRTGLGLVRQHRAGQGQRQERCGQERSKAFHNALLIRLLGPVRYLPFGCGLDPEDVGLLPLPPLLLFPLEDCASTADTVSERSKAPVTTNIASFFIVGPSTTLS
jgi:hypothetical protein